ncbi:MAG: hypothetical protein MK291_07995 [Planctomycetes bacterium]|nr:hypothetical protein [Planctomycetota bacterium]
MNRSVALFVAMALLVAHALAIHTTASGDFAPPYDMAFAAFRVGYSLVHEGHFAWGPEAGGIDSYPSFLWVLVSYSLQRLYLSINFWSQVVGAACALATMFLSSRFHSDRVASLVAPLLLAMSGSYAAASLSGTETALVALCFTAAFVANERGWSWTFGLSLALAGLARSEAWVLTPLFFSLRLTPWLKHGPGRGPNLRAYLIPILSFAALALLRRWLGGDFLSSYTAGLLTFEQSSLSGVWAALRDFLISSVSPGLLVYSLWYLLRKRLSSTGRRALFIGACWTLFAATREAESLPFNESMVPALPLLLIAVQEGLINALNSPRVWVRQLAWSSFFTTGLLTILVSRPPQNIGSIPLAKHQYSWLEPSQEAQLDARGWLGRQGLVDEIEKTQYLRAMGLFLRENVDANVTVLTPWPGAIGYLSRMDVRDLRGRATSLPGEERLRAWRRPGRTDVLEALRMRAGYIVPVCRPTSLPPTPISLATEWILHLDTLHDAKGQRLSQILEALGEYELVTVPLPSPSRISSKHLHGKGYLLRHKDISEAPKLKLERDGEGVLVSCTHAGHLQLADLRLSLADSEDEVMVFSPTGELTADRSVLARRELLLTRTGINAIELIRVEPPEGGWDDMELRATLINPSSRGQHLFNRASATEALKL